MVRHKITNGPGKFDLMVALFEGREVAFTIEGIGKPPVEIKDIGTSNMDRTTFTISCFQVVADKTVISFDGWYDTRTRDGHADVHIFSPPSTMTELLGPHCSECNLPYEFCSCYWELEEEADVILVELDACDDPAEDVVACFPPPIRIS